MQNINPDKTGTPIYIKTTDEAWPTDKMFYLLSKDGMFICRNHAWFRSCSPAKRGLSELAEQKEFCQVSYPKIPRLMLEKAVGFFHKVYEKNHWESALLLIWNKLSGEMELLCPDQKASWGTVKYEIPKALPGHLQLIGDLHSHGSMSPDPSTMDEDDELARPGIHGVVGWIDDKIPKFYFAVVVDGQRFKIAKDEDVIEGFEERLDPDLVPQEWMDKIKEHKYTFVGGHDYGDWHGVGNSGGYMGKDLNAEPSVDDARIINNILDKFLKCSRCPEYMEVRQALFTGTKEVTYLRCEKEAKKFVKEWCKDKAKHESHTAKE